MTSTAGRLGSLAARAGGSAVRQVRSVLGSTSSPAGGHRTRSGWLVVTVLSEVDDLDLAQPPAPLAELGDAVELRARPAAGGKGTELAARLRYGKSSSSAPERLSGEDPQGELRSALRRAKQLIEVGEVLAVDPVPHGDRTPTPGGALLESWTKAAPKAGVR
jgi:hypothetical protein